MFRREWNTNGIALRFGAFKFFIVFPFNSVFKSIATSYDRCVNEYKNKQLIFIKKKYFLLQHKKLIVSNFYFR
jgi:hypothetical protein